MTTSKVTEQQKNSDQPAWMQYKFDESERPKFDMINGDQKEYFAQCFDCYLADWIYTYARGIRLFNKKKFKEAGTVFKNLNTSGHTREAVMFAANWSTDRTGAALLYMHMIDLDDAYGDDPDLALEGAIELLSRRVDWYRKEVLQFDEFEFML